MKFSICVSGASSGKTVEQSRELAEVLGKTIAKRGHILTTGATVGLPFYAARAAHEAGGMSIGFSPAASLREHVYKYHLPIGVYDFINFTGMHYVGRDVHLVQSSDAVITVGGRFGSLHEFTTALESYVPCGVLEGSGGTADIIPDLMRELEFNKKGLVSFETDPEVLVDRMIDQLESEHADIDATAIKAQWYLDTPPNRRAHNG